MDDGTVTTTKLLTLLNVSATRSRKRRSPEDEFVPSEKLNKRRPIIVEQNTPVENQDEITVEKIQVDGVDELSAGGKFDAEDNDKDEVGVDNYERHFGASQSILTETSKASADRGAWMLSKKKAGKSGIIVVSTLEGVTNDISEEGSKPDILERLNTPFTSRQAKQSASSTDLQNDLLSTLSSRSDLYITNTPIEARKCTREAIALHTLNHVTKKRRRVLKNNERIAHAAKTSPNDPPPEDVQDQGFTRPSVLFLLPFRSSALNWFHALTSHTPPPSFQIENQTRFLSEYGLPSQAVDKLATAEPGTYPADHVETFKGNVDDNFRVGVKLTRKSVKMFTEFYGCDIILASPLGLRRSIEKEGNADYLTSIEVLVVDQMDALTMQNWEHVKFVMSHLNKLPKESRDTDFSRIKPWYLDGNAEYLRQSIILSAYETPETRSLYNSFKNVAGKVRTEKRWLPVDIPEGVELKFNYFDCPRPKDDPDRRFKEFTTQTLPAILKSAVLSANTVIFIPSSFDFIRIHNYFRKQAGVSFTVLSEYSSNQDISRARQAFFKGTKSLLLVSERFHFYKRYKIRGIRNLVFYGPPDHPQFLTEFLSYPFLDDDVEPSDVTCCILYSRYDWFKIERIAGTEGVADMINADSHP